MIYVAFLTTEEISYTKIKDLLPKNELERLEKYKNEKSKTDSAIGRVLLHALYRKVFKKEPPFIEVTQNHKPKFFAEATPFSISHAKHLTAVALSDEKMAIGIDVEGEIDDKISKGKIEKRFLSVDVDVPLNDGTLCVLEGKISDKEIVFSPFSMDCDAIDQQNELYRFLYEWTRMEAKLKTENGFLSFKNIRNIKTKTTSFLIFTKDKTPYILSISQKSK